MKTIPGIFTYLSLFAVLSCSGLKLDKDSNCINPSSSCFKPDKTPPIFKQAMDPLPYQPGNNTISTLAKVDLMFSEELNNPKPSDFVFSGPGTGTSGIKVNSIEQIDKYTYRLRVSASLETGNIDLDFPNLKDYNGNVITGNTRITYYGNVDIVVPFTVNRNGISSSSGYNKIDVTWSYIYLPPTASNTIYTVRLTNGSTDCNSAPLLSWSATGTALPVPVAGSNVSSDTPYSFSIDTNDVTTSGDQVLLICVSNATHNKRGTAAISFLQNSSAPATTLTPGYGPSGNAKALTFTCGPYMDKIIYSPAFTSGTGIDPALTDPVDPTFNASTGAVTSGSLYDSSNKPFTPYVANPTHSVFEFRCIDRAGNIEAIKNSVGVYVVDSNLPEVAITHVYRATTTREITGLSNKAGSHQSADIIWHTNQVNKLFSLRKGSTSCVAADGTLVASGTTPGVANQDITTTISYNSPGIAVGINDLRLCVQNGGSYGQDTRTVIRTLDNHTPATTVNIAGGSYGTIQNIVVTCNDTNPEGVIYDSTSADGATVPTPPTGPLYSPIGVRISGFDHTTPITLVNQKTTTLNWRCIDIGGNESTLGTATYTIDSVVPLVNVTYFERPSVSNLAGAYPSVLVNWTTDKPGQQYEIRNSGNCNGGYGGGGTATRYSGTAAASNSQTLSIASGDFPTVGALYNIKVCVFNAANIPGYQPSANDVTRDETRPQIPDPIGTLSGVNSTTFNISWNASTDNIGVATYRIFRSTTTSFGTTPDYTAVATSTTLVMPDTQKYFLRIVPVDAAGNTPVSPANYTDLATKPDIRLIITNLSGTVKINDGAQPDQTFNANISTPGNLWTTPLATGQTYNFDITQQPTGQICAIQEKQFGPLSGDLTINVNCATGNLTGGTYRQTPPAPLNYFLYRGNTTTDVARNVSGVSSAFVSSGVAVTSSGTAFVADPGTSQIYRISGSSLISVAGNGSVAGIADGVGSAATFYNPTYMASDGTNLYINQVGSGLGSNTNDGIRKLDPAGNVTTLVGSSSVLDPEGIAVVGNMLYWCNRGTHEIKSLNLATGAIAVVAGLSGSTGTTDATGTAARFNQPMGLTALNGKLYVAEYINHRIRMITIATQQVSTLSGSVPGQIDGPTAAARFNGPTGITTDGFDLYVTDYLSRTIRRIHLDRNTGGTNHIVSTISGSGASASNNGIGVGAAFTSPVCIATNGRQLFVSDEGNGTVRRITDANLVGYWPLNATANDYNSSGTAIKTGTPSGTPGVVTGRYGEANGAYRFNATSTQSLSFANTDLMPSFQITAAAWIKVMPGSVPAAPSFPQIISTSTSTSDGWNLYIFNNGGEKEAAFILKDGANAWSNCWARSRRPIDDGKWHHVTGTFMNNNIRIYVDGHLLDSAACAASTINYGGGPVASYIGTKSGGGATNFEGMIADARVYQRVISEGEINELAQDAGGITEVGNGYNTGATGLLSHYEMTSLLLSDMGAISAAGASNTGTATTGKDGDTNGAFNFNNASSQFMQSTAITKDGTGDNGEVTVAAWVNPTSLPGIGAVYLIAARYTSSDIAKGYYLEYFNSGGTQKLYWTPAGNSGAYTTDFTTPLNKWTHVAVTHSGTTATFYVNGTAMPTAALSARPLTPTALSTPILIGSRGDGNFTDGKIDDVRVYNRALSPMQIRQVASLVPAGLVARYDFNTDRNDVSGFGQDLSNNGVTLGNDRLSLTSSAAVFNGSANFDGAMNGFPLGTSPRTICAWTNPAALSASFSEVMMYGVNSTAQGWGFGMDNARMFILDTNLDIAYNSPHGLGVWRMMCAAYSFDWEYLYVDGALVASKQITLNTTSGSLAIGRGIYVAPDYFTGSIDDLRIYNRVLTTVEMQALQQ